jgi:hypothetical protein
MGTNYYVRPEYDRPDLEREEEGIHLGKSAAGWVFTFRAYPHASPPVMDFGAWTGLLELGTVYDEYRRPVDQGELLDLIADSQTGRKDPDDIAFLDDEGFRFIAQEFS